jgi:Subtilase family
MGSRWFWVPLLVWGLSSSTARADNRFILRTTLNQQALQAACNPPLLPSICTVVGGLGDPLGQLFLITTPLDLTSLLNLVGNPLGIIDAELDQLLSLVGGLNRATTPYPAGLSDTTPVTYSGSTVWDGYVNQPAANIVRVSLAQTTFNAMGTGIVADIDTGVDPNHPALKPVLLPGYDFTRNQPGGSEMTDYTGTPPSGGNGSVFQVNQSTAAVLEQSTAAVLEGSQYAAFGHGTMVLGVIHLVAPQAQLLPLKAFSSDGTGYLSNILHAVYYGVQSGTNVINMSFEMKVNSVEFKKSMDYANQNGVICASSAGNDGMQEIVYPAAYQSPMEVMGVASTSDTDTRSSFSNYGNAIVWVAAPGEGVISTYPFSTYAAGWGTSFSAPLVSGAGALLLNLDKTTNQSKAATAVAHAVPLSDPGMGNGRLDLVQALQSVTPSTGNTADFAISVSPATDSINSGQSATFTVSVTPSGGFNNVVMFSCSGLPTGASCNVAPSTITLDGTTVAHASFVVMTTQRSAFIPSPRLRIKPRINPWATLALLVACVLFWVSFITWHRVHRPLRLLLPASAILLAALCASCGGGYVAPPNPGKGPPGGTPAGTYLIVVTATSGNVSHAATTQLTVN